MLVSEIQLSVKRQFGDESGALITDTDILRWINDAQVDIVRQTDALQDVQAFTIAVVGTSFITLPTTYLYVKRVTLNGVTLSLVSLQAGFMYLSATVPQSAQQGMCYVSQGKLYVNATDALNKPLVVYYGRRPVTVTSGSDTPELPVQMHEDIVRYCISRAKELNEDMIGSKAVMDDYNRRMLTANHEVNTPDSDSYNGIRVLDGDQGDY